MEAALADGEADLRTALGPHHELTTARLWQGQVLVDWQRDAAAGGCLLRPALVRRLLALHAAADTTHACEVRVRATGRMVTSLSPGHARLVARLEQPPELHLRLRFDGPGGAYLGGDETYQVGSSVLLRLTARIRSRAEPPPVSART